MKHLQDLLFKEILNNLVNKTAEKMVSRKDKQALKQLKKELELFCFDDLEPETLEKVKQILKEK